MSHPRMYNEDDPILHRLRAACLALPQATEVEAWGRPTFRAGRIFVAYGGHSAAGEWPSGMLFRPDPSDELALRADPRFFVPKYRTTWLGLDLTADPDWDEVAELAESSYRQVALRRMVRALDRSRT
jgi:hypothetical protein